MNNACDNEKEVLKKYIGTKNVKATPMSLGDFRRYYRDPYSNSDVALPDSEEGYLVEYEDGYRSWSPKNVFEKAYKPSETPLDRMSIELDELCEKGVKLEKFRETTAYYALDEETKAMLSSQCAIMGDYVNVLKQRHLKMKIGTFGFDNLSFSVAIHLLNGWYAMQRAGWKGMFVVKQVPSLILADNVQCLKSLPDSAKNILKDRAVGNLIYRNQMLIINSERGEANSWVPSSSDIFADDWQIYRGEDIKTGDVKKKVSD